MAFPINNRAALVTGGGSGIGFAFGSLLHSQGCNVVIADLRLTPEAQELVDISLNSSSTLARIIFVRTDVTEWKDLEHALNKGRQEFGRIDIFCPAAGIFEPTFSNFWNPPGSETSADTPDSNGYKTVDVNLVHPIRLTQLAISHFLANSANLTDDPPTESPPPIGAVICISSIAGQSPNAIEPIYAITKAGMNALVHSFATLENSVGIRVAGVAPGLVSTPLLLEDADKAVYIDRQNDFMIDAGTIAKEMLKLVTEPENIGGTLVEVSGVGTRKVNAVNDPGPDRTTKGFQASFLRNRMVEIVELLRRGGWGIFGQ